MLLECDIGSKSLAGTFVPVALENRYAACDGTSLYLECRNCKEKIHCDRCEAVLTEALGQVPGIDRVEIYLAAKKIFLESNRDPDVIEGALEDAGIFVK